MTELNGNVIVNLLKLFDTLTREFHNLNSTVEKIEKQVQEGTIQDTNIANTCTHLNQQITSLKELSVRIELMLKDVVEYKNTHISYPEDVAQGVKHIDDSLRGLDPEFLENIKKLATVKEDLEPLTKLSRQLAKPLGVVLTTMLFILALISSEILVWKMYTYGKDAITVQTAPATKTTAKKITP